MAIRRFAAALLAASLLTHAAIGDAGPCEGCSPNKGYKVTGTGGTKTKVHFLEGSTEKHAEETDSDGAAPVTFDGMTVEPKPPKKWEDVKNCQDTQYSC
jgi:hypothetical protein